MLFFVFMGKVVKCQEKKRKDMKNMKIVWALSTLRHFLANDLHRAFFHSCVKGLPSSPWSGRKLCQSTLPCPITEAYSVTCQEMLVSLQWNPPSKYHQQAAEVSTNCCPWCGIGVVRKWALLWFCARPLWMCFPKELVRFLWGLWF